MAQIFCEQCGERLSSQSLRYCERCGSPIRAPFQENPAIGRTASSADPHDDPLSDNDSDEKTGPEQPGALNKIDRDQPQASGDDAPPKSAPHTRPQPRPIQRNGRLVGAVAVAAAVALGLGALAIIRTGETAKVEPPQPAASSTQAAPDAPSMKVVRRVDMGKANAESRPGVMLLSGPRLVVTHPFDDELTVLDLGNDLKKSTVRSPGAPWILAQGRSQDVIYTANYNSGTVSAFDLSKRKRVATAAVGSKPIWVGLTPDQTSLYVINSGSGSLSVVAADSFTESARIPLGGYGFSLGFAEEAKAAFIPMATNGRLARIDMLGPGLAGSRTVGRGPTDVAVSGQSAYVTLLKGDKLIAVDTLSGAVERRISIGKGASRIILSPEGSQALIIRPNAGQIVLLDLQTSDVLGRLNIESPSDAAYTPDGNSAVVVSDKPRRGAAYLVTTTGELLLADRLKLGGAISDVTVDPDGSSAFLLDNRRNQVAQVALTDMQTVAPQE